MNYMNQAVMQKARELAYLIAQSPEYISMRAAEDAAAQEETLVELSARYQELHQKIEDISMQDSPDFDQMGALTREMDDIQEKIGAQPLAQAMRQARNGFTEMMRQVNAELSNVLNPQSACSGDCGSCGSSCPHCH